jgi:hypothetical protein
MRYEIKNFETEGTNKFIGFKIIDDQDRLLYIDKRIPIVPQKTNEQYISEALSLCEAEIVDWQQSFKIIGKIWNPNTNSLE